MTQSVSEIIETQMLIRKKGLRCKVMAISKVKVAGQLSPRFIVTTGTVGVNEKYPHHRRTDTYVNFTDVEEAVAIWRTRLGNIGYEKEESTGSTII